MEKLFHLRERGTNVRTEIMAGITTFMTMAYILAVNPYFLSQTGMDFGRVFAATAIASAIATLVMGLAANLPFALSAGMGLNAFFAYTVCLGMGYSWQWALSAIFVEGIIFILLTFCNIREAIVNSIPQSLKKAIGGGIVKPDPEIFLKACRIAKTEPSEAIVLEDSENGVLAAYNGGIPVICIPDMKQPSDDIVKKASVVLDSAEDVVPWLCRE